MIKKTSSPLHFFLLISVLASCSPSKQKKASHAVQKLNDIGITMFGTTICQTTEEVVKKGGRLCYHVYPYAQTQTGSLVIGYAIKKNKNGKIDDIYITTAEANGKKYSHIGGFTDNPSYADFEIEEGIRTKMEVDYLKKFRSGIPTNSPRPDLMNSLSADKISQPGAILKHNKNHYDKTLKETAIREAKEEVNWNLVENNLKLVGFFVEKRSPKDVEKYMNHITRRMTFVYVTYLGEIDHKGNLVNKQKNIRFTNFKAKGFDDIALVKLVSAKEIEENIGTDEFGESLNEALILTYRPLILEIASRFYGVYNPNTIFSKEKFSSSIEKGKTRKIIQHLNKKTN